MVLAGSRSDTIVIPGARRVGLANPSWVGPRLENDATVSSPVPLVLLRSAAPTVMTKGSSAGLLMVPAEGPRFPAATTTVIPENHTCSTA